MRERDVHRGEAFSGIEVLATGLLLLLLLAGLLPG